MSVVTEQSPHLSASPAPFIASSVLTPSTADLTPETVAKVNEVNETTPKALNVANSTTLLYLEDMKLLTNEASLLDIRTLEMSSKEVKSPQEAEKGDEGKKSDEESDKVKEYVVILDRTVMYPQGGGQPSDVGIINFHTSPPLEFTVTRVNKVCVSPPSPSTSPSDQLSIVEHIGTFTTSPPPSNHATPPTSTQCTVHVDPSTRTLHSQLHSAGHLLDVAVMGKDYLGLPFVVGKAYHYPASPYVEYKLPHSSVRMSASGELSVRGDYGGREREVSEWVSAALGITKPKERGGKKKKGEVKEEEKIPMDRNGFKDLLQQEVDKVMSSEDTTSRVVNVSMAELNKAVRSDESEEVDSSRGKTKISKSDAEHVISLLPPSLPENEDVRLVAFGRFPLGPCCGTHCGSGEEIGKITIRKLVVSGKKPSYESTDGGEEERVRQPEEYTAVRICYDVPRV